MNVLKEHFLKEKKNTSKITMQYFAFMQTSPCWEIYRIVNTNFSGKQGQVGVFKDNKVCF